VLRRVRQPRIWSNVLRRAGLCCPNIADASSGLARDGTWLEKPFNSAGGARISLWNEHSRARRRGYYFQQRIDGLSCSAAYVAAKSSAVLLGVTRQLVGADWTGASGFCYCGSIGPIDLSARDREGFARIGAILAREFGLIGLFGVDAILDKRGVWPVEVNPRYTASMEVVERATGFSAVGLHVGACETESLPPDFAATAGRVCGKAILFASRAMIVPQSIHTLLRESDGEPWPALADVPSPGTVIERGWPIVTLLAEGPREHGVFDELRRRAADFPRQLNG
jgi:uncharacterized protein